MLFICKNKIKINIVNENEWIGILVFPRFKTGIFILQLLCQINNNPALKIDDNMKKNLIRRYT